MKLIDTQGVVRSYTSLVEHDSCVELDHNIFIEGKLANMTLLSDGPPTVTKTYFKLQFTVAEWVQAGLLAAQNTSVGSRLKVFLDMVADPETKEIVLALPQVQAMVVELINAMPPNIVADAAKTQRCLDIFAGKLAPLVSST